MKILVLFTLLFASLSLLASDIIITKDAKSIKAIVTEVSKTQIKYKDATNPKGPVYVLETSDVATIVYENGKVENFDDKSENLSQPVSANQDQQIAPISNHVTGQIVKREEAFYIHDTKIANDENELVDWMRKNYTNIYNDFVNYKVRLVDMNFAGMALTPLGAIVCGIPAICCFAQGLPVEGSIATIVGSVVVGVGIPLWCVGSIGYDKCTLASYYNDHVPSYSKIPLRLELQSSKDGIGLALKF